ncbi:DUF977 family protein [Candidatus Saccharibacteria bacterium]|nr:DUF977 family protein [Candidatus Saccharibacteria bacterium]
MEFFGIIVVIAGVYSIGVFTGVFVTRSIYTELAARKLRPTTPSPADTKKILTLAKQKQKITNNDVEKLLGVSDATATRYLDKLGEQNMIVQHGKTGRSVYYTVA